MTTKRALIIEDDLANRSIWSRVLSDDGYEVFNAEDYASSTGYIDEGVSLYLIDHYLPDGRGVDMIDEVRQKAPESVVVIMSMDDDAELIREAMAAGGNVFLVKPSSPLIMRELLDEISLGKMNRAVRQLINRHGRRAYTA
jgi:DNA-binding NtrC family response regulator